MSKCCLTHTPKTKFPSQKKAGRAMMRIISHTSVDVFDLHTYKCECGSWHVGHKSYYQKKLERDNNNAQTLY